MRRVVYIVLFVSGILFAQADRNLLEKGKTAFRNGQIDAAQKSLGKIISEYPESEFLPDAYFFLGEIAYQSGKYELAIKHYKRVVKRSQTELNARAYFRIAKSYEKLEDLEMAVFNYLKLVNFFPNSDEAPLSRNFIKKFQSEIADVSQSESVNKSIQPKISDSKSESTDDKSKSAD